MIFAECSISFYNIHCIISNHGWCGVVCVIITKHPCFQLIFSLWGEGERGVFKLGYSGSAIVHGIFEAGCGFCARRCTTGKV